MRGTALVGLAGATRRLGDVESAAPNAGAGRSRVRVGRPRRRSGGRAHRMVLVGDRRRRPRRQRPTSPIRRARGPSHDDPSMRMSAQTAAAAVAAVDSGSEDDIERFAALVRQRNGSDAGRFAAAIRRRGRFDARRARRRRHVPHAGPRVRPPLSPTPPTCLLQIARDGRFRSRQNGELSGVSGPVQRVDGC